MDPTPVGPPRERSVTETKSYLKLMLGRPKTEVIAVYRRGVVLPIIVVGFLLLLLLVVVGVGEPGFGIGVATVSILSLPVVAIWRREAAIFTADSLCVRPSIGRILMIPLRGIKRAYIHPGQTSEDAPTVRIQLLVGGEITVQVPQMDQVVELINKGAGKGL